MSGGAGRPATILAALWALALILLAGLWIRSPFTGAGTMFLAWSVAAAPLLPWSWSRFRHWNVRQVPRSRAFLAAVALAWAAFAALAASGLGPEMTLDGVILRRDGLRWSGRVLGAGPGVFGLALSVAGLAAALEARYRLAHGEAGPARGDRSGPDDQPEPPQER